MDNTQQPLDPAGQNPVDASGVMPQQPAMDMPAQSVNPSRDMTQLAGTPPVAPVTMQPEPMPAQPAMDTQAAAPTGPVTNEQIMEELHRIEDRLDEMDEKL